MTRATAQILDSGDQIPEMTIETVNHGRLTLPQDFGEGWGVFLIYRAHW